MKHEIVTPGTFCTDFSLLITAAELMTTPETSETQSQFSYLAFQVPNLVSHVVILLRQLIIRFHYLTFYLFLIVPDILDIFFHQKVLFLQTN